MLKSTIDSCNTAEQLEKSLCRLKEQGEFVMSALIERNGKMRLAFSFGKDEEQAENNWYESFLDYDYFNSIAEFYKSVYLTVEISDKFIDVMSEMALEIYER